MSGKPFLLLWRQRLARFVLRTFFIFFAKNVQFRPIIEGLLFSEPECGLVWAMLGRLYAVNYSLELMNLVTPLEDAIGFAEKGVSLNPDNQRARVILAFTRLFSNEIPAGLAEVEQALALNPNSLLFMDNIGYLFTLFGDWERGTALIRKAIKLNPYYNISVHYVLWVDLVRQEKYQQAYLETLNFRRPMLFWDPLIKAATLPRSYTDQTLHKIRRHCRTDYRRTEQSRTENRVKKVSAETP